MHFCNTINGLCRLEKGISKRGNFFNKLIRSKCTMPCFNFHENSFRKKEFQYAVHVWPLSYCSKVQIRALLGSRIFSNIFKNKLYYSNRLIENKEHKIWCKNVDHEKAQWKQKNNPNKVYYNNEQWDFSGGSIEWQLNRAILTCNWSHKYIKNNQWKK